MNVVSKRKNGIVDDFLTDASKIIGNPSFGKLLDVGSTALIVGSMFVAPDKFRVVLGAGLATKAVASVYDSGGVKDYLAAIKEKAFIGLSENERMKVCNRSLNLIKSGLVPDISEVKIEDRAPDVMDYNDGTGRGISRFSLNTPALSEKVAIKRVVGYIVEEFNKKGVELQLDNIHILPIKKNPDNTYSVPIELKDIQVNQFKGRDFFTLGYGKDASRAIPMFRLQNEVKKDTFDTKVTSVSNQVGVHETGIGLKGLIDTNEFDVVCKQFEQTAEKLKKSGEEFFNAKEREASFAREYGTQNDSGLLLNAKRIAKLQSLEHFREISKELSGCVDYSKEDYNKKVMAFSVARNNIQKVYTNLVSQKLDKNYNGVTKFDAACDKFCQLIASNNGNINGIPDLDILKHNYGVAVKENNDFRIAQEVNLRMERIDNSPAIVSPPEWGAESFYNTSMSAAKKAAEGSGKRFTIRKTEENIIKDMLKQFGDSKTVAALNSCSPSCVNNNNAMVVVSLISKAGRNENVVNISRNNRSNQNQNAYSNDNSRRSGSSIGL